MFTIRNTFSSFSVDDLVKAQNFFSEVAGLKTEQSTMGLRLYLPDGDTVFLYQKQEYLPASFTVLNFVVSDPGEAVVQLKSKGEELEYFEGLTGEDRILHGITENRGPDIAWFRDPAGNIIPVLQD